MAYLVVPPVVGLVGALGGYNPQTYEPKDFARQSWLADKLLPPGLPLEVLVNVVLFVLVAVVWLALVPPGASRR